MKTFRSNRRAFLRNALGLGATAAMGASGVAVADTKRPTGPFGLSVASYTFRKFDLAEALEQTRCVGIDHICLKSFHLPLKSTAAECAEASARCRNAGVTLWAGGVITMKNPEQVAQAFSYAKASGMRCIVGVPHPNVLPLVERRVRETDIGVAIHNHGPGDKLYPLPQDALQRIKDLDKRIGVCVDIGHTLRIGGDPAEAIRVCGPRVIDVHFKDVSAARPEGHEVEIGRGVIDVVGVIRALKQIDYRGLLSFEYEKDPEQPLPGLAESVGFVRGVVAAI